VHPLNPFPKQKSSVRPRRISAVPLLLLLLVTDSLVAATRRLSAAPRRAMINCDVVLYERRSAYFTARLRRVVAAAGRLTVGLQAVEGEARLGGAASCNKLPTDRPTPQSRCVLSTPA